MTGSGGESEQGGAASPTSASDTAPSTGAGGDLAQPADATTSGPTQLEPTGDFSRDTDISLATTGTYQFPVSANLGESTPVARRKFVELTRRLTNEFAEQVSLVESDSRQTAHATPEVTEDDVLTAYEALRGRDAERSAPPEPTSGWFLALEITAFVLFAIFSVFGNYLEAPWQRVVFILAAVAAGVTNVVILVIKFVRRRRGRRS